jgi:hypothetical protein
MLAAGAVCPHPPVLVPAALGAAASDPPPELQRVAGAAVQAVQVLASAAPDLIVVVGGGPGEREYGPDAAGSLRSFGIDATVGPGAPVLPLSLTVGRWLLERAGILGGQRGSGRTGGTSRRAGPGLPQVRFQAVGSRAPAAACRALGAELAARQPRVALLAMGDASARRAQAAPGAPDPQAQEYDEAVAKALATADAGWLARLDPALDAELVVAGRAAWQVLAGAAEGRRLAGRLLAMAAPYDVTYLVATWTEPEAG